MVEGAALHILAAQPHRVRSEVEARRRIRLCMRTLPPVMHTASRLPSSPIPFEPSLEEKSTEGSREGSFTALRGSAQVVAGGRLLGDLQRVGRAGAPVQRQRPERQRLRHAKVHAALRALHHAPVMPCKPQSSSLALATTAPDPFPKEPQ